MSGISIAKSLEAHLLQPLISRDAVVAECLRAAQLHLAAVCVWPVHVKDAARALAGSDVRVRAAVGFPYGQETIDARIFACDRAIQDGAHELAVMLDHSELSSSTAPQSKRLLDEIDRLLGHTWWSSLSSRGQSDLTLVIETGLVEIELISSALDRLHESSVGFLQTGSGHHPFAAREEHVQLLRKHLPADVAIICVGGISTLEDAQAILLAGATRVGSATAASIAQRELEEVRKRSARPIT